MLVTRYKCGNERKVVKNDKINTNTNKTSARSMCPKIPSPLNL